MSNSILNHQTLRFSARGARSPPGYHRLAATMRCNAHHPRENVGEICLSLLSPAQRSDNEHPLAPRSATGEENRPCHAKS